MIFKRNGRTYTTALIVLALVGLFHLVGIYSRFYFLIPWYDIPMHFLGGLWVGFSVLWLFGGQGGFFRNLCIAAILTLGVAVVWEIFEFTTGITYLSAVTSAGLSYWADTIKDIAMGTLGGTVAFIFDRMRLNRTKI